MSGTQRMNLPVKDNAHKPEETLSIPRMLEIKRDGGEYSKKDIATLMEAVASGELEDAQLGALLMAIYIKGLTTEETAAFTRSMMNSGRVFKWPSDWKVVDKHSTGGVGDKVSLPLAPALASRGLKVPMISGRGLSHTGGTLDKLESIPGYRVCLTEEEMTEALKDPGCCIVGQTSSIVPADKRMYAIRDVTATVPSVPLTVSSIISKKACEGLNSLVLDVKFGCGAFMKTIFEAESLAEALASAGESLGIKTSALVTRMDHPLGKKIGNALEVEEALECLRGEGPRDLEELVVGLGGELLVNAGVATTLEEGKNEILKSLQDGSALKTFGKMIKAQGVSDAVAHELCGTEEPHFKALPTSNLSTQLPSQYTGYITDINAKTIGEVCGSLGAGRRFTSDKINYAVGVVLHKVVGEYVKEGEVWSEIRHDEPLSEGVMRKMKEALTVGKETRDAEGEMFSSRIFKRISSSSRH